MKTISRVDLQRLIERRTPHAVSLYLSRGLRGASHQDPIRLRNLSRRAVDALRDTGLPSAEARRLLAPVNEWAGNARSDDHSAAGVGIFVCPGLFEHYHLPFGVPEMAVVGERFHLKPLLALAAPSTCFYVLAISQRSVALFEGDRHRMRKLDTRDVPGDLVEALGDDTDSRSLQYHTGTGDAGLRQRAIFHSHRTEANDRKEKLTSFFRVVDRGIADLLEDRQAPLVIAAVDYLIPIFKQITQHPVLSEGGIEGSPVRLGPDELHGRALSLLGDRLSERQHRAASRYLDLSGTGTTGCDPSEVVPAALDGRIETLFVALESQLWGHFDASDRQVRSSPERHPGDEDLLDLAAVQSFVHGATVFVMKEKDVPGDAPLAAIYRY